MNPTKFTQGQGRLSADILNQFQDTSRQVEQMYNPFAGPTWDGPHLMKVVESEAMQTTADPAVDIPNRWLYALIAIGIEDIRDPDTWTNDTSLSTEGLFAINMVEAPNTATDALGVPIDELPEGFELQPIPDKTLVWAYFSIEVGDPGFLCVFSATNQFHGECPE